jgi:hypothetical protein
MSIRARALGACCLCAAAAVSAAHAQPRVVQSPNVAAPAPSVPAHRVSSPMTLDGSLDEAVYASTPAIGGFVQQEPNEFQPATEKTEAWIFFDDRNIYVSARCFESEPARRVANEMRRDTNQLRQNDTFAVLFDTFHDRRNGYLFYANSIGGFADSQITDEGLRRRVDHRDGHPLQVAALRARPRADLGPQPPARGALEERMVLPGAGATGAHHVPRHAESLVGRHPHRARGAHRHPDD